MIHLTFTWRLATMTLTTIAMATLALAQMASAQPLNSPALQQSLDDILAQRLHDSKAQI